jgi:rhamnogalacturonan endolyase
MIRSGLMAVILVCAGAGSAGSVHAQRYMEDLNRATVAVHLGGDSIYIGWRMLATDPADIGFNLYRVSGRTKPVRLNSEPLTETTDYIDVCPGNSEMLRYFVKTADRGETCRVPDTAVVWPHNYLEVPLQTPENYSPGDISVGDLDGDGDYEMVVHMTGRGADNSRSGITSEPILDAYKMDGTLMWRINLGVNIREGAHYTQFMVYDLDGDGKAEVACKTADGTVDGQGKIIGNADSVYRYPAGTTVKAFRRGREYDRDVSGRILRGPEYLSVFSGETGAELATARYIPRRQPGTDDPTPSQMRETWGDDYGNRMDRFLACIAYLDGERPSLVMCRGYYTRAVLAAWNWRDGKLTNIWTFDSDDGTPGNEAYRGQGNHNLSVGDVDGDGKDEIIYGACVIDDDGTGLYSTGLGHGDAIHFGDLDPQHPGLEVFDIQERFDDAGISFRAAGSGEILWKKPSVKAATSGGDRGEGPGRGACFNIDPRYPGSEGWAFGAGMRGLYNAKGELISEIMPRSCNFAVWWDSDLLREILDRNYIAKWNWESSQLEILLQDEECRSNNGTKATPGISADLFGDWREEVVWRTRDNRSLRIYTTTIPARNRFYTFMQDPIYRLGIAWQNVAYNQPPHTSFYIGSDMKPQPRYNIRLAGNRTPGNRTGGNRLPGNNPPWKLYRAGREIVHPGNCVGPPGN